MAVQGDTIDEANETVAITLSGVSAGATLGTSSATLTITDDDTAGTLAFSSTSYSHAEGDSSTSTASEPPSQMLLRTSASASSMYTVWS